MQDGDRIKRIRDQMLEGSQPNRDRRRWDALRGIEIGGNKNVYAHNVVYQFGGGCPMATRSERRFRGVDWSVAPKLARWWAIDADGNAHWFCTPNVAPFTDFWFSEPIRAPDFGFDGEWRDSLTERPRAD